MARVDNKISKKPALLAPRID